MLHLALASLLALQEVPSIAPFDVERAVALFEHFDQNGDGTSEIEHVHALQLGSAKAGAPRVLVLVEPRLLEPLDGGVDLAPRLERLAQDLEHEGRRADVLTVAFTPGGDRDGRLVLALRELLRTFAADSEQPLEGALLVGHFPDALVVRTIDWWRVDDESFPRADGGVDEVVGAQVVRRVPEPVALRADIVLSDLDGHWEDIYVEPRTEFEYVVADFVGEYTPRGGTSAHMRRGSKAFEDCFHVVDGRSTVVERDGLVLIEIDPDDRDHECSADDKERPNSIPRPDITVSRIDARGTAQSPRVDVRGTDGGGLLDEHGHARTVEFAGAADVPHWREGLYAFDPVLERELLADFFDRNHGYRTGAIEVAWRAASLSHELPSGYGVVRTAARDWIDADREHADVSGQPSIAAAFEWLLYPAILRTVRAHSDSWGAVFGQSPAAQLDALAGERLLAWTPRENTLVPSLGAAAGGGKLDWFLLRSLWRHERAPVSPSFYVHTGCEAISPPGITSLAYDDPRYGTRQGAEALMFFGGGLALVGRAKVFYDEPAGFCEALGEGATFGEAWRRGFELESQAERWGQVGGDIGRKRSLFWSVLGDFTLRLERRVSPN